MNKAVVLFSGGIDSTAIIYHLLKNTKKIVYPIYFNYGQKQHQQEVKSIKKILDENLLQKYTNITLCKIIDISHFKDIFNTSSLVNDELKIPRVSFKGTKFEDNTNVPMRGVIFTSIATAYAESVNASEVYMMNHATNEELDATHYDGNQEAITNLKRVVELGSNGNVTLQTPFLESLKKDIFQFAYNLNIPFKDTWTCYNGNDEECHVCRACYEKQKGLMDAGIYDKIVT